VFEWIVGEVMDDVSPSGALECSLDAKARALIDSPGSSALATTLRYLRLHDRPVVDRATVAKGLRDMGYRLGDDELQRLMQVTGWGCRVRRCAHNAPHPLPPTTPANVRESLTPRPSQTIGANPEQLTKDSVISSQMDWRHLQRNHTAHWLALAKRAFATLDGDGDGEVDPQELLRALQTRLSAADVDAAFAEAVREGAADAAAPRRIDFASFMRLLRVPSQESLDLYDDRLEGTVKSLGETSASGAGSAGGSLHGSVGGAAIPAGCGLQVRSLSFSLPLDHSTRHGALLPTVFESGL